MKQLNFFALVLIVALVSATGNLFGVVENYSDGSYTEFTESGGYRHWVHTVPVGGNQYRVQYDIKEQNYSYNGTAFRGELHRFDDTDLDGATDTTMTGYYAADGAAVITKHGAKDAGAVWFHQYADTTARRFSSAYTPGRADYDTRSTVRVYANAFCYVQADGSCVMETNCDPQIQSVNQLAQFNAVTEARKTRDSNLQGVRIAELRYEREQAILTACKAARR